MLSNSRQCRLNKMDLILERVLGHLDRRTEEINSIFIICLKYYFIFGKE
jgi:hypothetical protein